MNWRFADYESKQALHITQTTVVSLRERLEQKEETVARFEKLLKQVRMEFDAEMGKKQEEIVSLKSAIRNQSQTIQTLKSSALLTNATYEHNQNPSAVIRDKMERIEDLEDEVLEMQSSIRFGFCGLNFLSILSHFLLREKLTQKNRAKCLAIDNNL